ncbi:MAG TPA: LysM peptidoglycan-binding domain-containing protein [Mycobacteriales bacterium]|nr:LysM peptidoglycan-binding domain-containing protein [Mycobacteriales bacterium]
MSVAPDLPIVDLPSRRRRDRASVIPFPRPRNGQDVPPRRPARPPTRRPRSGADVLAARQPAAPAPARAAGPAIAARPGPAPAGGPAVAGRPELTVVAGAAAPAEPAHLVGLPSARPAVLVPVASEWAPPRPRVQAPPARPGQVRLTRRGRLVLVALAVVALASLLTVVAPAVAHLRSPTAVPASAPAVVVVQPGDTLWSIARRVAPDRDTRLVVADLRRLNSLSSADLEVGQRLTIRAG